MAKAKDVLLKVDPSGEGTFKTVVGMRLQSIALGGETINLSDADALTRWREVPLAGPVRRASISGTGIMRDGGADGIVREIFFDGAIRDWQVIVPDFGALSGSFQVTALEYSGEHNGEVAYEMALVSNALLSFTAA